MKVVDYNFSHILINIKSVILHFSIKQNHLMHFLKTFGGKVVSQHIF